MSTGLFNLKGAQKGLRTFYIGTNVYLIFEIFVSLLWIVNMLVVKFSLDRSTGAEYRAFSEANLFHFTGPITMWGIYQQSVNDNSVIWWAFFGLFLPLANDLSKLLGASLLHLSQNVYWAWQLALAQVITQLILTVFAIIWYTYWFVLKRPADLPFPVAFRPENVRKREQKQRQMITAPYRRAKGQLAPLLGEE